MPRNLSETRGSSRKLRTVWCGGASGQGYCNGQLGRPGGSGPQQQVQDQIEQLHRLPSEENTSMEEVKLSSFGQRMKASVKLRGIKFIVGNIWDGGHATVRDKFGNSFGFHKYFGEGREVWRGIKVLGYKKEL